MRRAAADPYYEIQLHETGRVQTRPQNLHDLFNALAWLAFPRTKALINALHAEEIPREGGRRGRRRDLLTLLDEGGVLVQCGDPELVALVKDFEWKALFWERRERVRRHMRLAILGHATLEQALEPWPGIACKALFVSPAAPADEAARAWLAALPKEHRRASCRRFRCSAIPAGCRGASAPTSTTTRVYFRGKIAQGVGRAAAARRTQVRRVEESPGSEEQDAG